VPDGSYLIFEKQITAPADLIYRAFTSAMGYREWLCDVSTTIPTEGGWIYLAWNKGYFASGAYTQLNPNKAVSFTWIGNGEPGWSKVDVVIVPHDTDSCNVVLRHAGFGQTSVWEAAKEEISRGWTLRRVGFELLEKYLPYQEHIRHMEEMIKTARSKLSAS